MKIGEKSARFTNRRREGRERDPATIAENRTANRAKAAVIGVGVALMVVALALAFLGVL